MILGAGIALYGFMVMVRAVHIGECTIVPESKTCSWSYDSTGETNVVRLSYARASFRAKGLDDFGKNSTCKIDWAYVDLKDARSPKECEDLAAQQGFDHAAGVGAATRVCSLETFLAAPGLGPEAICHEGSETSYKMRGVGMLVLGLLLLVAPSLVLCVYRSMKLCARSGGASDGVLQSRDAPQARFFGKDATEEEERRRIQHIAAAAEKMPVEMSVNNVV